MGAMEKLRESISQSNLEGAEKYTREELASGTPWSEIVEKALMPAIDKIGQDFSEGIVFLPELMSAGMAMSKAIEVIKGSLSGCEMETKKTIIMGTVLDDLHDIGKNIVRMNFELSGFKVIDLGIDVPAREFSRACRDNQADIVGISTLLSTTMPNVAPTIKQIREENPTVKIIIGGNPITPQFAEEVGADGYAPDAYLAVKKAEELLGLE